METTRVPNPLIPRNRNDATTMGGPTTPQSECNQNKPGFKKRNNKPKGKAFGNKTNAKNSWQRKTDDSTKEANKKEIERFREKANPATSSDRKSMPTTRRKAMATSTCWMPCSSEFNYNDMDNMKIDSDDDDATPKQRTRYPQRSCHRLRRRRGLRLKGRSG